jgi:hypothetical protein
MGVQTLIQLRRGSALTWISANPILSAGEVGHETDTGKYKIGDGITVWTSLSYSAIVPGAFIGTSGIRTSAGTNGTNLTISVTGIGSSQINDFNTAVDARISLSSVSEEQIQDIIASGNHVSTGFFRNGTGIAIDYDDSNNIVTFNTSGLSLSGHTHSLSSITDVTASATEVNYIDGTLLGTVVASKAVAVDANKDISGFRDLSLDRNLLVGGNLTVQGSTTTVNSTTVDIGDNIIQVNVSGAATQGGFQVLNNSNSEVTKLVWDITDTRWEFEGGGANVYTTGDLTAKTITSSTTTGTPLVINSTGLVSNLNADLLDSQHGSYYLDWNNTTNKPDPIVTGILTGHVTGSASVTLSDLNNGTLTIDTTIANGVITSGMIANNTIINEDINTNAAISVSKFAAGSSGQVLQTNSGGLVVWGSIDGGTP